jgi:hypothetical protein
VTNALTYWAFIRLTSVVKVIDLFYLVEAIDTEALPQTQHNVTNTFHDIKEPQPPSKLPTLNLALVPLALLVSKLK